MMDTDKKRKTIRCQKCGLTFSGERVYCPLCKKRIIDEGTEDSSIKEDFDVFPVTQKKQADFIFMKIIVLGAGKVGKTLIKHMSNEDHDIIVVDQNATKVEEVVNQFDVIGVVGNGSS